jgi:HAD superfamily hydrolase (TIGR01484 family)
MDLLVTDLDGTLLGNSTEFTLLTQFRDELIERRKRNNTVWAICTGRPLSSFNSSMAQMSGLGIVAEYAIVNHSQIFELTRFGYVPHFFWNMRIRWRIRSENLRLMQVIDEWYDLVMNTVRRVRVTTRATRSLRMRFSYENDVQSALALLEPLVKEHPNLQMFRYRFEIDIRPVPFTKGLAVAELCHHLGIGHESVLSIGDGYNDISMFDSGVSQRVGCPANAEPEVMQVVSKRGGHIATKPDLSGVLEILQAYSSGTVRNALPESWKDPAMGSNPRHWKAEKQKPPGRWNTPLLIAICSYTILLGLAGGHFLGRGLSMLILKPVVFITAKLAELSVHFGW